MKEKLKIAVIGLGSRGNAYSENIQFFAEKAEIVACADILPDRVERFGDKYGIAPEMRFSSGEELLEQDRLADIAFICTLDKQHYGHAMAALRKGYHLLLEKPISPSLKECYDIAEEADKRDLRVVVCHVMRYTNLYSKMKEVVDSGALGDIVSIEASEAVGHWHMAHSFVRGNWRNSAETSPILLQKSCHDMDMISWMVGKKCVSVSSFGSLTHFKASEAPEGATERCTEECPHYNTCPYSVLFNYIMWGEKGVFTWPMDVVTQEPSLDALKEALRTGPYGRCVYHCDNDVCDHQVVNILFEDGVTANFNLCAFNDFGRHMHIMGTKGELLLGIESDKVTFRPFKDRFKDYSEVIDTHGMEDVFGHGGGDYGIIRELIDLLDGDNDVNLTSAKESIESHVIALAAEESRKRGGEMIRAEDFIKANR